MYTPFPPIHLYNDSVTEYRIILNGQRGDKRRTDIIDYNYQLQCYTEHPHFTSLDCSDLRSCKIFISLSYVNKTSLSTAINW